MVRFDNHYEFESPEGQQRLPDLFDGRRQLVVYQFMDAGPDAFCPGCTHFTENVTDLGTLHENGVSFVVAPNMPLEQMQQYWAQTRWTVPFVSSRDNGFSDATGAGNLFRLSVFLRDGDDAYLTYSTTARGVDRVLIANNILDLTPLGKAEELGGLTSRVAPAPHRRLGRRGLWPSRR